MVKDAKTAMLVLAAGKSSRMGQPKQLLPWKNSTLLGHTITEGKASGINHIYVVLGACQDKIRQELTDKSLKIIYNPDWELGMGSSIATGIREISKSSLAYEQVLIALCDQPLIDAVFYRKLLQTAIDSTKPAVGTCYGNTPGVPAVFKSSLFQSLEQLKGKTGAKALLKSLGEKAICLKAKTLTADIDTPETYKKLVADISKK
jgi:molybdenum cofactor cytidylyltransferase